MFALEKPVSGLFHFTLNLEGTASSPVIRGKYALDQAAYYQFRLNRFDGNFSYSENLFTLKSEALPENAGKIEIEASLPLQPGSIP
jgi:autotransporter translocation and assembly factor TamB